MGLDIWKKVEIDGEEYSIRKFTATEGLQLVRMILEKISPIIPALSGEEDLMNEEGSVKMLQVLGSISDDDVANIMRKCLRNCFKVLPAGNQAVMDSAGRYGIADIEYDMMKAARLCWEAIQWGCSDFFGEKGSALMSGAKQRLSSQQSQSTTTPSSSPQS